MERVVFSGVEASVSWTSAVYCSELEKADGKCMTFSLTSPRRSKILQKDSPKASLIGWPLISIIWSWYLRIAKLKKVATPATKTAFLFNCLRHVLKWVGGGRWQTHDFFFDITKEIHDYEFFLCLTRCKLVLKMREIFVTKRFHSFFQVKIFQMEKSARNLIQNASMFGLISSVKFQTLVIVRTGKSKKIHMLKSFFFWLPIPSLSKRVKIEDDNTGLSDSIDAKYCQMTLKWFYYKNGTFSSQNY